MRAEWALSLYVTWLYQVEIGLRCPQLFWDLWYPPSLCLQPWAIQWHPPKGQITSKGLLVSSSSPKKRKNEFIFTTTTNSFVRFLGEFKKSPFEIIWPLTRTLTFDQSRPLRMLRSRVNHESQMSQVPWPPTVSNWQTPALPPLMDGPLYLSQLNV